MWLPDRSRAAFKERFRGPAQRGDDVYEFLYVNGGTKGGKWTWGLVGRVNGALLEIDALQYFIDGINQRSVQEHGCSVFHNEL